MRFYHIKDDYIAFLRKYDATVAENKQESRPYVGIVCEINEIKYYAPFTSPKPKHLKMKNGKDFRKIKQGEYSAINFNNMIPVPDSALILIDIANIADAQYQRLLQNQYKEISKDIVAIEKTACELRTLVFSDDSILTVHDKVIKNRCCNLPVLESVYKGYENRLFTRTCG